MSEGVWFGDLALPAFLLERLVRRAILDVAVASERKRLDDLALAAARLRALTMTAERLAASSVGEVASPLERVRRQAAAWLPRGFVVSGNPGSPKRDIAASQRPVPTVDATDAELVVLDLDCLDLARICLQRARLFDVMARRALLDQIDATSACIYESRFFGSSFRAGIFDDAVIVDSDLSCADLSSSRWRHARLSGCTLLNTQFTDTCLHGATFTDCDLRAASFDAVAAPNRASAHSATFVRCDLRGTRWTGRQLAGATFIECKLQGARGPNIKKDEPVTAKPHLSTARDGSELGAR